MKTYLYLIKVNNIEEKKQWLNSLNSLELLNIIRKQLPMDQFEEADYLQKLPDRLVLQTNFSDSSIIYAIKSNPWDLLFNIDYYVPICIYDYNGDWYINTTSLVFVLTTDNTPIESIYPLSFEETISILKKIDGTLTFNDVNNIESNVLDLLIEKATDC